MITPRSAPPDASTMAEVAASLRVVAERTAVEGPWSSGAMQSLAQSGVLGAFVPADAGGSAAGEWPLLEMLAMVAEECLTTALVLSQWAAAVRIIATAAVDVRRIYLPPLARGETFTTVGVSQITTSRQHVGKPALAASRDGDAWRLDGLCPWVTGADEADTIVTGAATAAGERLFFVVPVADPGLSVEPPMQMLALSASRTSAVRMQAVRPAAVLAAAADAPRSGGLATTALALGATRAAARLIAAEGETRPHLRPVAENLLAEAAALAGRLREAAVSGIEITARDRLRGDANGLVTRSAQAALTAAKGAGFVRGHPAERLARESLFFLVWSCPPAVSTSLLCELAHVD